MKPVSRKVLALLLSPVVALTLASSAWAQFDGPPSGNRPGMQQNRPQRPNMQARQQQMMQQLGITPEQAEQLKKLREQGQAQSQALRQELQRKRQALMQYMQSPDANQAKARQLFQDLHNVQGQLGELRIKTWFQMRQNLTAEQVQKLEQLHRQRMQSRSNQGSKQGFNPQQGNQQRPHPMRDGGRFQPGGGSPPDDVEL